MAIQETKIYNSISHSELFPESVPYCVYRKDRILNGGGVMLLVYKNIPHMPLTELDTNSESVWVNKIANKTSYFVASWYRPPDDRPDINGDLLVLDKGNNLLNSFPEKV